MSVEVIDQWLVNGQRGLIFSAIVDTVYSDAYDI
jgi:hypothetical protein